MAEPQYSPHFKLPRKKLGAMANERYLKDPKLFGISFSRYKHVSKLLSGQPLVAEIGAGCGFFSRVVAHEVGELNLFDYDKRMIDEIYANGGERAFVHNILEDPLPYGKYSAAYSLDVFEHVPPENEDDYLHNVRGSLEVDGVFICGIPSLESQIYASEASKEGHVNCKSMDDFKKTLEKYFKNVFVLSMHDETLGTSFGPMSQYLLAICVC